MYRKNKLIQEITNRVINILSEESEGMDLGGFWFVGPNPAVDMIVLKGNNVLLITRKPGTIEGGKLALPGGFINTTAKKGEPFKWGSETPKEAAIREVEEETGLNTEQVKSLIREVGIYDDRNRDPRNNKNAWAVSYAFVVQLPSDYDDEVHGRDDASDAEWVPLNKVSSLAFDHSKILRDALSKVSLM